MNLRSYIVRVIDVCPLSNDRECTHRYHFFLNYLKRPHQVEVSFETHRLNYLAMFSVSRFEIQHLSLRPI